MATNTSTTTANYGLSQYGANDPVKVLTNYNADMLAIDSALKAIKDESDAAVPNTRKVLGNPLSGDITLAQLIAAGLCPAPESGTWDVKLYGETTAGSPTYATTEAATWTKIGKFVILHFSVALTSLGGMAGILHIKTLPFPIFNRLSGFAAVFSGTSHNDATGVYFNGEEGHNSITINSGFTRQIRSRYSSQQHGLPPPITRQSPARTTHRQQEGIHNEYERY